MDNARRLATAVTIARRCVAAVGRDASPDENTADGTVLADAMAFADITASLVEKTRERLDIPDLAPTHRVDILAEWAWPIHTAMLSARPLPAALAEIRDEVEDELQAQGGLVADSLDALDGQVYALTALRVALEFQSQGKLDEAKEWLRLGRESGHLPGKPVNRTRRLTIIGVSLALPVALVVWLIARSGGDPEPPSLPYSMSDYAPACDGKAFPAAPAYAGAAPHNTVVLTAADDDHLPTSQKWALLDTVQSGMDVMKFSRAWRPDEARTVQAVACVDLVRQSDLVQVCNYRHSRDLIRTSLPTQISMFRGYFTVTVIEVRTARRLHHVEVTGDRAVCPQTVALDTSSVHTELTADQLKSAIGHLIDG
ncbi:hypothetical protein [Actinomadura madurae]|uniref:Uncharacterized protein n=1 Tax=Actinomadura madurae TaxID=1993 RepID=A0A1I5G765_9ACTN|nr:hypothetical protein [Actinomadura madurae]SFO31341.1 hypothetical protein SAMN04489713_10547 [Actinomadura madurae]SPT51004.1 Uncharacterised protein [Actinomadura madurae]